MNKKLLMPLLALAIIPAVVFGFGLSQPDADAIGKQFAADHPGISMGVSTTEEAITEDEEINRASLIVEGTVLNAQSKWVIIHNDQPPRIFTDYKILVDEVIKGQYKKVIKVTMSGGTLDGVTSKTSAPVLEKGDRVIMILGQDLNSLFGDNYTPVSISKSTYVIDETGNAENRQNDRSNDKEKVKERILDIIEN